jgi:hypothetical protein
VNQPSVTSHDVRGGQSVSAPDSRTAASVATTNLASSESPNE